jgi:hypothetical protein
MILLHDTDRTLMTVTAIYDTAQAGYHISEVLGRLKEHFGSGIQFRVRLWRSDLIEIASVYHPVHDDATGSDLMAIAFVGGWSIQNGLVKLAGEWAEEHRGRQAAMVVIPLGNGPDANGPLVGILRRIAGRNGIDFLCATSREPAEIPDPTPTPISHPMSQHTPRRPSLEGSRFLRSKS